LHSKFSSIDTISIKEENLGKIFDPFDFATKPFRQSRSYHPPCHGSSKIKYTISYLPLKVHCLSLTSKSPSDLP